MSAGLNVGSVVAKFTADTTSLKKGVSEAKASVASLGASFGSAGDGLSSFFTKAGAGAVSLTKTMGLVGTVGAAAIGMVGLSAVKSGANLEQTRIGLETMLGSADKAKALMTDVVKLAAQTPFEFPELAATTKKLLAFGVSETEVVDKMRMLGDVAAGTGAPLSNIATVYGQVRAAGRLMGQDMNQFINAGIPMYEELSKVMGKPTTEIKKLGEEGKISFEMVDKALQNLTSGTGRFTGMMEKQSKSLSGLWSTLSDNVNLALMKIIGIEATGDIREGSIFDKLRNGAGNLIAFLDANSGKITAFFEGIVSSVSNFTQSEGFQMFIGALKTMGEWIIANKDIVIPFLQGLAIALGSIMIITTIAGILATLFSPIGLIVAAITLMYLAWKTNFLGIQDTTKSVIDFMVALINYFKGQWDAWGRSLWESVKANLNLVWKIVTAAFDVLTSVLAGFYLLFTGQWGALWELIKSGAKGGWDNIKGIFSAAVDAVKANIIALYDFFIGKFDDMWNKAKEIADKIRHAISDAFDKDKHNSPSIADKVRDLKSFVEGNQFGFTPNVVPQAASSVNQSINATINNGVDLDMLGNRMAFLMRNT